MELIDRFENEKSGEAQKCLYLGSLPQWFVVQLVVQGRLFVNAVEGDCRRTVHVQPESRKAVFDLGISELRG